MKFTDIIYGNVDMPDWIIPFLKIPEFVRLRGVRLSNVDSYQFKDFGGATRWEHCIGVAHLAIKIAKKRNLSKSDSVHLILAALLHDVATPPFAHTIEYVIEDYNHELESNRILSANESDTSNPSFTVFASQLPQFRNLCTKTSKQIGFKICPDTVAEMITGGRDLGFLINGSIDLDNIDNVTRACLFLGIKVNKNIPYELVDWLVGYESVPTDLDNTDNRSVIEWISYKNQMYSKFFSSASEELGRQAFLQHLIRRSYKQGLPKKSIIWNTDDGLLNIIERYSERHLNKDHSNILNNSTSLQELVERYRLLECAQKIIEIPIDNLEDFKTVRNPSFASWLEDEMSTPTFEPFVMVNAKRFNDQNTLFNREGGIIQIFRLGNSDLKLGQLPKWMQNEVSDNVKTINLKVLNTIVKSRVLNTLAKKPWLDLTSQRKDSIKANLESVGNWSFRLSRNQGLHSYPATFVHAIPATLINTLGLKGQTIIDTFGGTGQTATEAIKNGCTVISADNNIVATMIAKAKLTYLSKSQRNKLLEIDETAIKKCEMVYIPKVKNIDSWHHKRTQIELSKILSFIDDENNPELKIFLQVCFSDILTSCTARKGLEHGYFADNTPLSKSEESPQYENAIKHFINKITKNVGIIENFYSYFERNGLTVESELSNAKVLHLNTINAAPKDYGIEKKSVDGIITSPPYLCMADYTLGQRLTYYWLFPEQMNEDFKSEIGSRRSRMQNGIAIKSYYEGMRKFAKQSALLLKKNGFLATVIGAPQATAYKKSKVLEEIDKIFEEEGFELFWETNRPISWHRNHGYARLKEERVAVHILR